MHNFSLRYAAITFSFCMALILFFSPWQVIHHEHGTPLFKHAIYEWAEQPRMHRPVWNPPSAGADLDNSLNFGAAMEIDRTRLVMYLIFAFSVSLTAGTFGPRK